MTNDFGLIRFATVLIGPLLLSGCLTSQESKVSVDYYQISGNSTAALDREIKRKGPKVNGGRHAVAVARIKMTPNVTFTPGRRGCSITKAKVSVNAKVTLPRWNGRDKASRKLGKAWDNIDRYTRLHEAMHVAIAFRFARQMESELLALSPGKTCERVKSRAKRIVDRYLELHDERQKAFDSDEQIRFTKLAKEQRARKNS